MAKRKRTKTEAVIDRHISEGRGQGRGYEYKPWLLVQDVASQGLASRIKGWKTNRVHHLLSNLELNYFYILEWSPIICDIREQYPLLPLEETLAIAEKNGIPHPKDPKTQDPMVMTTDFLITVRQKIGVIEQVRTLKLAKDLQSERTLQKLEIERQYWQSRDINWGIVTEHEIPERLARNIDWVHPFFSIEDCSSISESEIRRITTALTLRVVEEHDSLASIAADCDDQLGFKPGIGLSVARHLIANRWWLVDMNKSINPSEPLVLLANPLVQLHQKLGGVG
ncbi:TnsA endonuclease N-terminal domain-containing protein [Anabaena lutea]|uniref:TnsA endonuclease N-terminal domain-containing protein n=1 Tax=Anabaena lutea FACHB-196 TaxID=2692881 RepID=A0ABR8FA15_9NOST|nr:TnsA endonuclease C-terminal domain-containing protein [Anabaena lutea]MBD2566594.1 TnsA endonuclease N-terminal domain-containing protein [Anabaena lutea FACHB-196]